MIPLSFAQRRLWFLHRMEGPSATYNVPFVLRLSGPLDTAALLAAVTDVVARHESLRTLIVENADGTPEQRVLPPEEAYLQSRFLTVTPDASDAAVQAAVCQGFDLETPRPPRATVFQAPPPEPIVACAF